MFEKFLKRTSWEDIVVSAVFIVFGILLAVKPTEMVSVISILLGAIFIIMGCLKILEYFTTEPKEDYLLTMALVSVIFGVILILCYDVLVAIFAVILGLWMIVSGVMDLQTALVWKEVKSSFWTLTVVLSMLIIIAGIVILVNGSLAIRTIGIITIIYAIFDIIERVIFMKKMKEVL